jgi:hypothetical protein
MHPAKLVVALAFPALLLPSFAPAEEAAQDPVPVPGGALAGAYLVNGDTAEVVVIEPIGGRYFSLRVTGEWEGVGVFDGKVLWGAFRYAERATQAHLASSTGSFRAVLKKNGALEVQGGFVHGWTGRFTANWERMPEPPSVGDLQEQEAAATSAQKKEESSKP